MTDELDDDTDRTVSVRRERGKPQPVLPDDDTDRTVSVRRPDPEPDDTDRTVALSRKRAAHAPEPDSVMRLLPARPGIAPPPVPAGARSAVNAVGPNVVDAYVPRPLPESPVPGPPVPRAEGARRGDAALPSVARTSRATGRATLLVFAASCVLSAGGLIAVIVWFARG